MITTDRRRSPRENTVESLDRDVMLMRELLEVRLMNQGDDELSVFLNRHEIEYLTQRIPELVEMRRQLCAVITK